MVWFLGTGPRLHLRSQESVSLFHYAESATSFMERRKEEW